MTETEQIIYEQICSESQRDILRPAQTEGIAERIQARAIRRCGDLIGEIEPQQGKINQYTMLQEGTLPKQTRFLRAPDYAHGTLVGHSRTKNSVI